MNKDILKKIHKINYLLAELDALYHQAALKIGIADSALSVLYTIYDNGESCLLSDIYKQSGISKQTVNSAIRNLEKEDIVFLEQYKGKSKMVLLTEKGKVYIKQTAALIYEAEKKAYESWSENEINTYISLLEKYEETFKQQVEKM